MEEIFQAISVNRRLDGDAEDELLIEDLGDDRCTLLPTCVFEHDGQLLVEQSSTAGSPAYHDAKLSYGVKENNACGAQKLQFRIEIFSNEIPIHNNYNLVRAYKNATVGSIGMLVDASRCANNDPHQMPCVSDPGSPNTRVFKVQMTASLPGESSGGSKVSTECTLKIVSDEAPEAGDEEEEQASRFFFLESHEHEMVYPLNKANDGLLARSAEGS